MHRHGRDEVLGLAFCDHDLLTLLEAVGITDPEQILDDPVWVQWIAAVGLESAWRAPSPRGCALLCVAYSPRGDVRQVIAWLVPGRESRAAPGPGVLVLPVVPG